MTGPGVTEARLAKVAEQLEAARVLIERGLHANAAHALYFAVFHAVSALLAAEGIAPSTHRGTQQMFSLHFIRSGRLPEDFGWRFSQLMDQRGLADYGLGPDVSARSVAEARASVLLMLPAILDALPTPAGDEIAAFREARLRLGELATP
jgi:uncharacterized protein (UPF0332 family)